MHAMHYLAINEQRLSITPRHISDNVNQAYVNCVDVSGLMSPIKPTVALVFYRAYFQPN